MSAALAIILAGAIIGGAIVVAVVLSRRGAQAPPIGIDVAELYKSLGQVQEQMSHVESEQHEVLSNVAALVTNPGKRGVWGELTLLRLLENAGLKRGVDFDRQVVLDAGRPDVVVHLGDAGEIVVDSKAPIVDLKAAWDADGEEDRRQSIKRFADAVRRYAKDLAKRDYAGKLETTFAPVLMYIPIDGAWEAAREMREDILSEMMSLGIYPAEPSTMGMTISLIKQHARNSNQEEAVRSIIEDTRRLLDGVRIHVDHLEKVGSCLGKAVDSYDKAIGNMDRTMLPAARRMSDHVDVHVGGTPSAVRQPDMDRVERLIEKTEVS